MKKKESVIESIRRFDKALSVSVNISHNEVDRITVNRLIQIRNSDVNKNVDTSFIDKTIRWFLVEDEFKKHVIGNKLIKF
jgi:hypothetical protein